MAVRVDSSKIEGIVGASRHRTNHIARAVSAEQTVYILHSQRCFDARPDLLDCPYTEALDRGIDIDEWVQDQAIWVMVSWGRLVPADDGESP